VKNVSRLQIATLQDLVSAAATSNSMLGSKYLAYSVEIDSLIKSINHFSHETKTDEERVTIFSLVQGRVSIIGKRRLIGCFCSASASVSISRVDIIYAAPKKKTFQFSI
jgi:hypothetical protein